MSRRNRGAPGAIELGLAGLDDVLANLDHQLSRAAGKPAEQQAAKPIKRARAKHAGQSAKRARAKPAEPQSAKRAPAKPAEQSEAQLTERATAKRNKQRPNPVATKPTSARPAEQPTGQPIVQPATQPATKNLLAAPAKRPSPAERPEATPTTKQLEAPPPTATATEPGQRTAVLPRQSFLSRGVLVVAIALSLAWLTLRRRGGLRASVPRTPGAPERADLGRRETKQRAAHAASAAQDFIVKRGLRLYAFAHSLIRRVLRPIPIGLAVSIAVAAVALPRIHDVSFLYLLYVGVSLLFGAICWTTLVWMLYAWRTPGSFTESRLRLEDLEPTHSFSLIVPARHEEAVLEVTLSRLVTSDHPAFEVLVVVGSDDPATRDAAERVASRHPELVKVVVDASWPKNKPKALNTALPHCTGSITGVFDAEDDVHPQLLHRVDQCFQTTGADVVQAGVQLMDFRSSWFAVRNVLEYYFWFRSRLHFQARQGFIPLGGNTVFVRTHVLQAVEGWDADCLAEDCELGVRLSALGAHTVVVYEPELVTREECPSTLGAFARQRTRWNQGFLQTLSRGYWRRLPRRQRALGVYTLAMPYLMAFASLLIPIAIVTAVVENAPVPVTLISFLPVIPMLSILAVEIAGLGDFCRTYGERASIRDYARLVFGLPLYLAVLAFASARAVVREAQGVRGWEKTAHHGLHLAPQPGDGGERSQGGFRAGSDRDAMSPRGAVDSPEPRPFAIGRAWPAGSANLSRMGDGNVEPMSALLPIGSADSTENDQAGLPSRTIDGLFGARGREPLWVRLNALSTNGSASLSLPDIRPVALGAAGSWLGRVRARLRAMVTSRIDVVVLIPLLAGVGLIQATNMLHWPGVLFDEGTYVGNAWAVQERGTLAFYTYTYGHPPLGWLVVSLWTWAIGIFGDASYSIDGARVVMLAISIVGCSLLYTLARRLGMGWPFAAGAVILFALSPLSLFFHRAFVLDNPATVWALAAFVLALTPRRRLWAFAGSGACFAASVLSKETTLVLLPALLLAMWQNADQRTRRYCLTLFFSFLGLIVVTFPLYAALKGELLPGRGHVSLLGTDIDMLFLRKASGSVFDSNSVAHGTVMSWLQLDPWLLESALVLSPFALARRNTRAVAVAFLIQVGMLLRPGYLPAMYVVAFLPFAALIVAGSADALWRRHMRTQYFDRAGHRGTSGRRGWRSALSWASVWLTALAIVASTVVVARVVAPDWIQRDRVAMTARFDAPQRAADRWLVHNVGHEKRLIVTDDVWIYLIEHGFDSQPMEGGFNSRTVVSYWPLDYDPAVKTYFPNGWRDFDYVVSTDAMRVTAVYTPTTARALAHSRVVARFGQGGGAIEIRQIIGPRLCSTRPTAAGCTRS